jgi:hypothetical protein
MALPTVLGLNSTWPCKALRAVPALNVGVSSWSLMFVAETTAEVLIVGAAISTSLFAFRAALFRVTVPVPPLMRTS